MADQDGRHSEMITQLLRHVTLIPHNVDVKGDIFRHIYPPSLAVRAFIFSELRRGAESAPSPRSYQKKPGLNRVNLKSRLKSRCQLSSTCHSPTTSICNRKRFLSPRAIFTPRDCAHRDTVVGEWVQTAQLDCPVCGVHQFTFHRVSKIYLRILNSIGFHKRRRVGQPFYLYFWRTCSVYCNDFRWL